MKEIVKHDDMPECRDKHQWRGYTIDELERRRLVTSVKIDLVKEQIAIAYRGMTSPVRAEGGTNLGEQFNQMLTYASYGMQFVKAAKRLVALYRSIKSIFGAKQPSVQAAQ